MRSTWIVSKSYDLRYFVFPCLLSLLIFSFFSNFLFSFSVKNQEFLIIGAYFIFDAFFDSPHIFQSFSRTHKDKTQYSKFKFYFKWGLLLLILVDGVIFYMGYREYWMIGFACLGYYHIMKQNIGLIKAYKNLNKDFKKIDYFFDVYLYVFLFLCSGFYYFMNSTDSFLYFLSRYLPSNLFVYFFISGALAYLLRQAYLKYKTGSLNSPKVILTLATLLTNFLIHSNPALPIALIIVMETIYHDVQYQGWIRFYQKRFFEPEEPKVLKAWLLMSFAYGTVFVATMHFYPDGFVVKVVEVFFLSFILFHYLSDGVIWKFSKDENLRKLLLKR